MASFPRFRIPPRIRTKDRRAMLLMIENCN